MTTQLTARSFAPVPNTAQHFPVENAADKAPTVMLKQLKNGKPAQIDFTRAFWAVVLARDVSCCHLCNLL